MSILSSLAAHAAPGFARRFGTLSDVSRFLNFLTNSPSSVLLLGAAILGLVVFVVPPWHPWAWVAGLVVAALILVGVLLAFRRYQQVQSRIDTLNAELASERENVKSVTRELSEYKPMTDNENDDTKVAKKIIATLPNDHGLLPWLRVTTKLTSWDEGLLRPLATFLEGNRRTSFEDAKLHPAFMDLYRSGQQLSDWFAVQGTPREGSAVDLTPGDEREGGWREYGEARTEGETLAEALLQSRATFARIGMETGTLPTR